MHIRMKNRKLNLGLGIGIAVLAVMILLIYVLGGKGGMHAAETPADAPVTITEVRAGGLSGSYTDASGKLRAISIPTDEATAVEDVNGQEIGLDELTPENMIRVKVDENGKAEKILLLPDARNDFC